MSERPHDNLDNPFIFVLTMVLVGLLFLAVQVKRLFRNDRDEDDDDGPYVW